MPFLHLPVQSFDKILAAMNRRYTANDYRRLVDRLARRDLIWRYPPISSDLGRGGQGFCRNPAPCERYRLQSGFLI